MTDEDSNIQHFTIEYLDDGKTEIEFCISADVDGGAVSHIEFAVLAQVQCNEYPRIEEYEVVVLQNMRALIAGEIARIERIVNRPIL